MKLQVWYRTMIVISVAWLIILTGFVVYEYQSRNVFCDFDGAGTACQHIFWLWSYVSKEKYEFILNYGRLLATAICPIAALWFCFASVVWIRGGSN